MKKLLCFLLCLTLIFSSVSLCFASPTQWDTSDQANLRYIYQTLSSGGNLYNLVNGISNKLTTVNNYLDDISDLLFYGGHSIADIADSILTWMSPIYQAIQQTPINLEKIYLSLGYTTDTDNDGNLEYHPYLYDIYNLLNYTGSVALFVAGSNGTSYNNRTNFTSPFQATKNQLEYINKAQTDIYTNEYINYLNNALISQSFTGWSDLENHSFTPSSGFNGIYTWLSKIQTPVARLSYVLASDERIAAQEAAAANEEAVVDNFIDSSGDGAASPSDIGSVSGLSSGYKQNFGSDASPSGIFDIFNSDHATWFSQETKNQLDTTTPSRMTKGSVSNTPLLDKQIEDIYDALGVKQP